MVQLGVPLVAPCNIAATMAYVHGSSLAPGARCSRLSHTMTVRQQRLLRCYAATTSTARSEASDGLYNTMTRISHLKDLSSRNSKLAETKLEPRRFVGLIGERVGLVARQDIEQDGVVLEVPEEVAITFIDAEKQEVVGQVAAECSELIALTLWLMAERAKGSASAHHAFLSTLPDGTLTPILWDDSERQQLLNGSPVLPEARSRAAELECQWHALQEQHFSKDQDKYPPSVFNFQNFSKSFSVVLAHAIYLPSAECFALLPIASLLGRTGNQNGCTLDYDASKHAVVVKTTRPYREGQEVLLDDGRPNGELLLATGNIQESNLSDMLMWQVSLIPADRYYTMKSQILEAYNLQAKQQFPVYADRMPNQLLAYLRLSRIADPALFAKVSFEQDIVLSQMNEYEVLQLLMGDCRERLAAYLQSYEEDVKLSQDPNLTTKERLAVKLRLGEKRILNETMTAVRRRLAPIRGIPTKQGFQDANSDLKEIFDTIEAIPSAPKRLLDGFLSWASGKDDPDWGKKGGNKRDLPPRPW